MRSRSSEEIPMRHKSLKSLFPKELLEIAQNCRNIIVKKFKKSYTLSGYCGLSSLFLQEIASKYGFHLVYKEGNFGHQGHAWLEYKGHIVDITATQFLGPVKEFEILCPHKSDEFGRLYSSSKQQYPNPQYGWCKSLKYSTYKRSLLNQYNKLYSKHEQ